MTLIIQFMENMKGEAHFTKFVGVSMADRTSLKSNSHILNQL